jgi:peptidoglycan-N-acetylglucosamine deacetylase
VCAWGSMVASSQLFGQTVRHTGNLGSIGLTFDDGPNPSATPALLDLLELHGAKGTFFMVGKHVREFPKLAAEIVQRGHSIGNHTESHPRLNVCSPARTREELELCAKAIADATGKATTWMRPPYGYRSPWLDGIVRSGFHSQVVMWSRMARDWAYTQPEPVIQRLRGVKGGDIVVLHDGDHRTLEGKRRHIVQALEYWLPRWKDAGKSFPSMDQLQANTEVAQTA